MKSRLNFFRSILIICTLGLVLSTQSAVRADDFKTYYDQGKFNEAYELLQKTGIKNSVDYYNAANCLYRLSRFGLSLAYFQKALALQPSNTDIRYNLKLAEEALNKTGQLTKDKSFWRGQVIPLAYEFGETIPYIIVTVIAAALAFFTFRKAKSGFQLKNYFTDPLFVSLFFTFIASAAAAITVTTALNAKLAVVVADSTVARSGPSESFTELFRLNAGTTIELTGDVREGWNQIKFSIGNIGWISEKDLLNL